MKVLALIAYCFGYSCVLAATSSKALEGYPDGFLSHCPGSSKKAVIVPKSLKRLTMSVVKQGGLNFKKNTYNYYQVQALAKDPSLDFKKKTLLFCSGFLDSTNFPASPVMATAYKDVGYNVIMLDTHYFTTVEYPIASRFSKAVGFHTAEMLAKLTKMGLDPKKLELLGMSLGGQTIGFIAKSFRDITGMNISRITALDPSGPCFRNLGPEQRIDASDADFVDIVSTNMDSFGMAGPVGQVNFYINGGEHQAGDLIWTICEDLCSHLRAYSLWLSAIINPNSFIAIQCDSVQQARDRNCYERKPFVTNIVGLNTDRNVHGIFYVSTKNSYPYFLKEKGLKRKYDFYLRNMKELNKAAVIKM